MPLRRSHLLIIAFTLATVLGGGLFLRSSPAPPIRIGVLHSMSGTMSMNERPLVDAVRLAVEEINAAGGLLGRPVEMVVADGRSDNDVFAAEAERLIASEKVNYAVLLQSTAAPSGIAAVDHGTRHLWKQVHIGKARADGQFDLVWRSGELLRPAPFPDYRSRFEWQRLVEERFGAPP
jgi:hypothetical protein